MGEHRRASQVRQVELTDAALHIIATRGISALTTRALAEQVGLSSGAIFRHFTSLDAVLEAVVARAEEVLDATYPPSDGSARERLASFVEARSAAVGSQVGILRLVLSEQFLLALPGEASGRLSACVRKTKAFVLECLRQGQASGEVRADLDAAALTVVVMGTIQMLALAPSGTAHRTAHANAVRDTLLSLLTPTVTPRSTPRKRSP